MRIRPTLLLAGFAFWLCPALPASGQDAPRTVHVYVALCDNESQGIQPVPEELGDGDSPLWNLYWGALYGVKTYFKKAPEWEVVATEKNPAEDILERYVFRHTEADVYLVADAYRGRAIRTAISDFVAAMHGEQVQSLAVRSEGRSVKLKIGGGADLLAYIGHNGLMEFDVEAPMERREDADRRAIVLACDSRSYFTDLIRASGARPLLLTTGLMAPEAYTLKSALDGWIRGESDEAIRRRAAAAYDRYQGCGIRAAMNLFVTE